MLTLIPTLVTDLGARGRYTEKEARRLVQDSYREYTGMAVHRGYMRTAASRGYTGMAARRGMEAHGEA